MVPHRTPFLLLAALLIPTIVCADDYTGRTVGIIDGDTLEVLNGHHTERIRLSDIDCPEKGQAFGERSKPPLTSPSGRRSPSRRTVTTSTSAPLLMCFCRMG
jgi:endonuclease YncB( thermonuclease family)